MKYKVGDKVKIINGNYVIYTDSTLCSTENRTKNIGKIGIIKNVDSNYRYPYNLEDDNGFLFQELYFDDNLELVDELKEGDIVYASNHSKEDALIDKYERIYILTYPKGKYMKYACIPLNEIDNYKEGKNYNIHNYAYVVKKPIEEKKERKIECTDSERENIKNTLNIK